MDEEKEERLRKAVSEIISIGKKHGLYAYNFEDSWRVAIGRTLNGKFANDWLISCFRKTIEDFKKDCKDKLMQDIILSTIASELNYQSMMHWFHA